eukprot:1028118-Amphidinium_carterae.1
MSSRLVVLGGGLSAICCAFQTDTRNGRDYINKVLQVPRAELRWQRIDNHPRPARSETKLLKTCT